jgi:hypothetical protein
MYTEGYGKTAIHYELLLMQELSRRHMERVARHIGNDTEAFGQLMNIVLHGYPPVVQRAAWVMEICWEEDPKLFLPYIAIAVDSLPRFMNDGVKRQIVKILAAQDIPESQQGKLADLCFEWVQSATVPVAIKVHCMQILANLAANYPELSIELQAVIREQIPRNSVGFSSRGKKILKQLQTISCLAVGACKNHKLQGFRKGAGNNCPEVWYPIVI